MICEHIYYSPPKSGSFGHHTRIRNQQKSWSLIYDFLKSRTDSDLKISQLTCVGPSEWTEKIISDDCIDKSKRLFGEPRIDVSSRKWDLSQEQVQSALNLVLEIDKGPKQILGPIELYLLYSFEWKASQIKQNPIGGTQTPKSSIGVYVGHQTVFFQPDFRIYLPEISSELKMFLLDIEKCLPFRFRDNYFKKISPSKNGKSIRSIKLDKGWLHEV
ncbi:hypothetical protein ACFONG_19425 [Uliginosibacterium paludis]|uniref:Uncharacterized protein n=1 Tax=Uliginosibacterium paludis TaxID=1615952 RepID=A0ABV2CUC2_9RHOO